jgi:hypothetical protein
LQSPQFPSLAEVERIAAIENPVIRNLQITQCYHELSAALVQRTGLSTNWCTFATWASKQAGQTIRKEDLARLVEDRLRTTPSSLQAAESLAVSSRRMATASTVSSHDLVLSAMNFSGAIQRSSDAVGRGNKKVFEEIGREFARFYAACLEDSTPDPGKIDHFCQGLQPGEPPQGQRYLRQAFNHYYHALFEPDLKARAELIFLANIEIGFHEQTRLQPEIAESLDTGLVSSLQVTRRVLAAAFPYSSTLALTHLYLMRLLGRPTALDNALRALLVEVATHLRQTITEVMMTLNLPSGVRVRLGDDLPAGFPASLQQIVNPELKALLERLDPTADSTLGSGARDWADLPDRLHFIIDLFRCYQENRDLLEPPFTPEQTQALKAGKLPEGKL